MMSPREFLLATLITAGLVVAPAACSDDPDVSASCKIVSGEAFFPAPITASEITPNGMALSTQVNDPNASGDVYVTLVVALDQELKKPVPLDDAGSLQLPVLALKDENYSVKVTVRKLEPSTTYYYRFFYNTQERCYSSPVGMTKTGDGGGGGGGGSGGGGGGSGGGGRDTP